MKTYTATISHHSISRARKIEISANTLTAAKSSATREFGGEQVDYIIHLEETNGYGRWSRRVGGGQWVAH